MYMCTWSYDTQGSIIGHLLTILQFDNQGLLTGGTVVAAKGGDLEKLVESQNLVLSKLRSMNIYI